MHIFRLLGNEEAKGPEPGSVLLELVAELAAHVQKTICQTVTSPTVVPNGMVHSICTDFRKKYKALVGRPGNT